MRTNRFVIMKGGYIGSPNESRIEPMVHPIDPTSNTITDGNLELLRRQIEADNGLLPILEFDQTNPSRNVHQENTSEHLYLPGINPDSYCDDSD